jgi:hypothetical protein
MVLTYSTNGDHIIPGRWGTDQQQQTCNASTIKLVTIPAGSTLTLGCLVDSVFSAYSEGVLTEDTHVNHGIGTILVARVAGLTSTPMKIDIAPC